MFIGYTLNINCCESLTTYQILYMSEKLPNLDYNQENLKNHENDILELKEIVKSEKPVVNTAKKVEAVRSWNTFTFVSVDGLTDVQLYDENAQLLKRFSQTLLLQWQNIFKNLKIKELRADSSSGGYLDPHKTVAETPIFLQRFLKDFLTTNNKNYLSTDTNIYGGQLYYRDENIQLKHLDIQQNGKYFVEYAENGLAKVYLTQTENGIPSEPENWQEVDLYNPPEDLKHYLESLQLRYDGYKELNNQYTALVNDVGISILQSDNLKSKPVFQDHVPSIEQNLVVDANNKDLLYYCRSSNPQHIHRLDMNGDASSWQMVKVELKNTYDSINNLQLDPSGNFFLFYSNNDLVVLAKDTLEEVKRVPGLREVNFDSQERIRAIDKDGYLVIYEVNFKDLADKLAKERAKQIVGTIDISNIFDIEASKEKDPVRGFEHLEKLRDDIKIQLEESLEKIITPELARKARENFSRVQAQLRSKGLQPEEVNFLLEGLEEPLVAKEKEFAEAEARTEIDALNHKLGTNLSFSVIAEIKTGLTTLQSIEPLLPTDLREALGKLKLLYEERTRELFKLRGGEIITDINSVISRSTEELAAFSSKFQMDDWVEFRYPQLRLTLGNMLRDIPLEAEEAYKAVMVARTQLQDLKEKYELKFKEEYAKVREKAAERIDTTVENLKHEIDSLIERVNDKNFNARHEAEQYTNSSEARKAIEIEIEALANDNPDLSKELSRLLKVKIANQLTEIERGDRTKIAGTGQQMIMLGNTSFPKYEAKVKEKVAYKIDLNFEENKKSYGPGTKPADIYGDVNLLIRTSTGTLHNVRLYEGWEDENEWRLGLKTYLGETIPPSYVNASEFKNIKKEYLDWTNEEKSKLREEDNKKREELSALYSKREKISERQAAVDDKWQEEYKEKLKAYAEFCAKHHINLLKRVDELKHEPELEFTNGKGYVPEWQSHWVVDPQTEEDLEKIAEAFKMQLDLQEGLLNLKGHAGTGKDVVMKMFSNLTKRPYFGIDCTKWTTEFELSEDVMLESKDGASQTVKVPSTVLNGITTAGSIVYFNEFNAMPEQAQIFLHALMDEKRSLTLKTSSGKVIRAQPSVLLASSMNPNYPGTFDPQFATKSRMVSLEINYPPLYGIKEKDDNNPNQPYNPSEALRIARSVDSLSDLTYEANLERNEFIKVWDHYINGLENGAQEMSSVQKFDVEVILALVQFTNKLRDDFIKNFEKSRDAKNALPVTQPVTGRELRRCAYALSKLSDEEKISTNPEAVARELLDKFYLSHIDKKEDQAKIKTTMATWSSQKRVRA